jgi:hypothetical protein
VSSSIESQRREIAIARALDPGAIVNGFVLEVAVQARDPRWREREIYSPPLPSAAARAFEFVADVGF